jgi:deoxycytidylate deaminase
MQEQLNFEFLGTAKSNSKRLSFDEYGCLLALVGKSRSEDLFTRIGGAAFNSDNRVLGVAYNGLKPGQIMPDWMKLEENRPRKSDLFIHCESNLCALLTVNECKTIYLTQSPCIKCCQQIAALNIQRIVYLKEYQKCDKYKEFLTFHNIKFEELSGQGKNNIIVYIQNLANFEELYDTNWPK